MRFSFSFLVAACFLALPIYGQGRFRNPEAFRIELMGSGWLVNSGGQVQASGTPADFLNDLRVRQQQPTFFGHLTVKPGKRHRIEVEGSPYRLHGFNVINRAILFRGRTFNINETVGSTASLDYIYAGYQYDLLTGSRGHLGLSVGGAYLNATGTLATTSTTVAGITANANASKTQNVGLPLVGFDFRIFPVPGVRLFELEGGMRGMSFGDYGFYAQAMGQGGISLGHFAILAGYRAVNTSISVTNSGGLRSGIEARLHGPIFSGVARW